MNPITTLEEINHWHGGMHLFEALVGGLPGLWTRLALRPSNSGARLLPFLSAWGRRRKKEVSQSGLPLTLRIQSYLLRRHLDPLGTPSPT